MRYEKGDKYSSTQMEHNITNRVAPLYMFLLLGKTSVSRNACGASVSWPTTLNFDRQEDGLRRKTADGEVILVSMTNTDDT